MSAEQQLIAYEVSDCRDMPLSTAGIDRDWMDESSQRFAYRCLPLAIANQAGWLIANPVTFTALWDGGPAIGSLQVHLGTEIRPPAASYTNVFSFGSTGPVVQKEARVLSHFGHGILTFTIPYLFRTPRGVNLWVKGPTNYVRDGVQPLEGIVETDWLPATFTMNWKLTRPHHPVTFHKGEPICMVVPTPRGLAESLQPVQMPLAANAELYRDYMDWQQSRLQFNQDLKVRDSEAAKRGWQREYVKGITTTGAVAPEHQTRLSLKEFRRE